MTPVRVAFPPVTVTGNPRLFRPSLNWTVPETVPAPGGVTVIVAVKSTGSPMMIELLELVTAVVVVALSTTWVIPLDVESTKLVSPRYLAVIV